MRVIKRRSRAEASTQGFVWVMEDFAAPRTDASTIGGYRVLRSSAPNRRRSKPLASRRRPSRPWSAWPAMLPLRLPSAAELRSWRPAWPARWDLAQLRRPQWPQLSLAVLRQRFARLRLSALPATALSSLRSVSPSRLMAAASRRISTRWHRLKDHTLDLAWTPDWQRSLARAWQEPIAITSAPSRRTGRRTTGFLSVLLVGGLGVAVLAGPAACLCNRDVGRTAIEDGTLTLSRFAYGIGTAAAEPGMLLPREELSAAPSPEVHRLAPLAGLATIEAESRLPAAPVAAAEGLSTQANVPTIETEQPAPASPITTAAIDPVTADAASVMAARFAGEPTTLPTRTMGGPSRVGLLPASGEPLGDKAPRPVQLATAATGEATELAPVLPPVVIDTPVLPEVKAVDPEADDKEAAPSARPRRHTAARKGSHRPRRPAVSSKPDRAKLAKVPRWARQMFDSPWQSKAFSYIQ